MKKLRYLLVLLLLAVVAFQVWLRLAPVAEHESHWVTVSAMPTPRSEITAVVVGKQIYVAGGIGAWGTEQVFERFDASDNQWIILAPLPEARHHVALAAHAGFIYAVGGFSDLQFTPSASAWRYDIAKGTWQAIQPLPAPRGEHQMVTVGDALYVVAGSSERSREVWRYKPAKDAWAVVGDMMPTARDSVAAVVHARFIYVIGGRHGYRVGTGRDFNHVSRFDTESGKWQALSNMPAAKAGHAAALIGSTLYVYGGESLQHATVDGSMYAYDILADRWTAAGFLPTALHGLAGATVGDMLYAIGGAYRAGLRTPFALNPHTYAMPATSEQTHPNNELN